MYKLASIIISSYERVELFRRCWYSIGTKHPRFNKSVKQNFEVIVVDDNSPSQDDILEVMREFDIPWKLIKFDANEFTRKTGLKKFFNSPAVTNNIGFKHSKGDLIFQMGNEIIAYENVFEQLIKDIPNHEYWMVMSTTYDLRPEILAKLDKDGYDLSKEMVQYASQWPLQSKVYRSDVTNYISLAPRKLWEKIGGYDERYFAGISAEDSDFVRRARAVGMQMVISDGISLHQCHFGKTVYYDPKPEVISKARFQEGCQINRRIYDAWDGTYKNPQTWPIGEYGVVDIITNR